MGASLSNTEHIDLATTLPHSPSDIDVLHYCTKQGPEGSHQDFKMS